MPRHNNAGCRLLLLLAGAPVAAVHLQAQVAVLPRAAAFEYPLAHARPNGIYGRVLSVGRGESRFGAEREAEVGIGETFPVFALSSGRLPVTVGLGVGVAARFSLDDPRTAMVSSDWVVGVHTTADAGPWRFDLHLYHESSHLGDEYAERFGVPRVDWTREVASLWASRHFGRLTAHGNFSYTLIDGLDLERPAFSAGLDYRGGTGGLLGGRLGLVAGLYLESTAYARWRVTSSARLGVELQSTAGRSVAISLVGLDGLSSQRQFFRERSQYVGLELRFDL